MADNTEWLSAEEAAKLLHLHPNTVYRLIRDGQLPALRFPVRVSREHVDTLFERCRIKPGELAHLNAYARGDHRAPQACSTKAGTLDRQFGARRGPP